MGFCPSEEKANDLTRVLGAGSMHEQREGIMPVWVESAAVAYEAELRARKQVVSLHLAESDAVTLELNADEIEILKQSTQDESPMSEDPWAEDTQIRSLVSESGFFLPAAQVG